MLWGIRRSVDASCAEVYADLTDEAAVEARLTGAGACGVHVVEHDADADGLRLRVEATIPIDGTGLALACRTSAAELDWLVEWSAAPPDERLGTMRMHLRSLPVLVRGTIRLRPLSRCRTEVVVDLAATSSSALVDASMARSVGEAVASLIERDLDALCRTPAVAAA